jgi:hypothetical protein
MCYGRFWKRGAWWELEMALKQRMFSMKSV